MPNKVILVDSATNTISNVITFNLPNGNPALEGNGCSVVYVGVVEPVSPNVGDLWIDTN